MVIVLANCLCYVKGMEWMNPVAVVFFLKTNVLFLVFLCVFFFLNQFTVSQAVYESYRSCRNAPTPPDMVFLFLVSLVQSLSCVRLFATP